eukprot:CAMPEP_0119013902 /NCGR_PEP_ID=MMETSP1176-20130426/9205_1 /TAXON_ID=265551 /ORGANISM="Synedropsis recta cf, Strain CCMP1620" /LENGTH=144 /DNA_ID=CAMNT_0006967029 /DNA_START=65 /DNA_END=499 /DNA_ORIENTATION=+
MASSNNKNDCIKPNSLYSQFSYGATNRSSPGGDGVGGGYGILQTRTSPLPTGEELFTTSIRPTAASQDQQGASGGETIGWRSSSPPTLAHIADILQRAVYLLDDDDEAGGEACGFFLNNQRSSDSSRPSHSKKREKEGGARSGQ